MREAFEPLLYVPHRQQPLGNMSVLARTKIPPATLALAFRRAMQTIDSDVPVYGPFSLDERLRSYYWSNGMYGALFTIFAAVAVLMACVGLFAVTANAVSRRTQEIGVRIAIGATPADIRALVLRQALGPMAVGLAVGLCGSLGVNRALTAALVQVSPADPLTLMAAAAVLVLAALLGCAVPARRALKVHPLIAIRHE
jgi:putative ABC transport system permease protein